MRKRSNKNGFTLVEIMSGVAIIGLLAALTTPSLLRAREHVNEMSTQTTLLAIHHAMKSYRDVNAEYPSDLEQLTSTAGTLGGPPYLDESIAEGRTGYVFQIENSDADTFLIKATSTEPGYTGTHDFTITHAGVIQSSPTAPPAVPQATSLPDL